MSNLVEHAVYELGLLENDDEFNDCILKAIGAFLNYGHSGSSAIYGIDILNRLLKFENLTPLTDNPNEWVQHEKTSWQSKRNAEAFSDDGGRTYTLNSEVAPGSRPIHFSECVFTSKDEDNCNVKVNENNYKSEVPLTRIEAWKLATDIVDAIIEKNPLEDLPKTTGFGLTSRYTKAQQYFDLVKDVGDWLFYGDNQWLRLSV